MNPYTVVPPRISQGLKDWQSLLPEPLSGDQPLRTARLMLAAAVLSDMPEASLDASADFLRETALIRRVEWQQRLQFLSLLPRERPCERVLLALFMLTELTATAAQRETHPRARAAMDFLLPEACDMLYRTANLLSLEYGVSADEKLGGMAELMPGRPCIAAHRHPYDEVQPPIERAQASPQTLLSLFLLSCAARYAACLSAGALGESREHARALYAELSLILTEHATQYASLLGHAGDPCEALTLRAYALCYALDGLRAQEEDAALRAIYDQAFYAQCAHLHKARRLYLRAHEGQEPPFIDQELPPPLILQPNKGYIRGAAHGRRYPAARPAPARRRAAQRRGFLSLSEAHEPRCNARAQPCSGGGAYPSHGAGFPRGAGAAPGGANAQPRGGSGARRALKTLENAEPAIRAPV